MGNDKELNLAIKIRTDKKQIKELDNLKSKLKNLSKDASGVKALNKELAKFDLKVATSKGKNKGDDRKIKYMDTYTNKVIAQKTAVDRLAAAFKAKSKAETKKTVKKEEKKKNVKFASKSEAEIDFYNKLDAQRELMTKNQTKDVQAALKTQQQDEYKLRKKASAQEDLLNNQSAKVQSDINKEKTQDMQKAFDTESNDREKFLKKVSAQEDIINKERKKQSKEKARDLTKSLDGKLKETKKVEKKLFDQEQVNDKAVVKKNKLKTKIFKDQLDQQSTNVEKSMVKSKNSLFGFQRAMGSLSFLFIGQQIQRTMQRVLTSTVSTFTEITKSQTKAGQAITALSANFQYLKFTIGNAIGTALEPLLPTIFRIVDAMVEWINLHPKLAGFGLIALLVAGAILTIASQAILAIAGLRTLIFGTSGLAAASTAADAAAGGIGALATALGALTIVAGITLAIAGFVLDKEGYDAMDAVAVIGVGLIGAGVGFFIGGPAGAAIGLGIGIGIGFLMKGFEWNKEEGTGVTKEILIAALMTGLALAVFGFIIGGPGGAALGFAVGVGLSFMVTKMLFGDDKGGKKQIQKQIDEMSKNLNTDNGRLNMITSQTTQLLRKKQATKLTADEEDRLTSLMKEYGVVAGNNVKSLNDQEEATKALLEQTTNQAEKAAEVNTLNQESIDKTEEIVQSEKDKTTQTEARADAEEKLYKKMKLRMELEKEDIKNKKTALETMSEKLSTNAREE